MYLPTTITLAENLELHLESMIETEAAHLLMELQFLFNYNHSIFDFELGLIVLYEVGRQLRVHERITQIMCTLSGPIHT